MNRVIVIVVMGLLFIGCGSNNNSVSEEDSIDLPSISGDKKQQRIFQALDLGGKKGGDTDTSSGQTETDDNNVDNTSPTQTDTNAPEQNRDIVSEPFGAIEDIFTIQYSSFPANSTHQSTENSIKKAIVDDNGMVHVIVSQIAWWWGVKSNGNHENSTSRHFQYYYMNYNPKTKKKTSPKKIFEAKILNDGNLPDEQFLDFIMSKDSQPIILSINYKSYTIKQYMLNGSVVSLDTQNNNKYIDNFKLFDYKGKIYLTYRDLPSDNKETFRLKRMQIYPNIGKTEPIVDEYLHSARISGDMIFFYSDGVFFKLDNNMKVILSTREEIGEQKKYFFGTVNIYDSSVKELLLDDTFNIVILNQDGSKESIFQITDSVTKIDNHDRQNIVASVFKDKVIIVYLHKDENQYKVVVFDRYNKTTKSILIGSKVYGNDHWLFQHIAISKDKRIVVGNIDGKYEYSAQLTVADIATANSKSIKEKILTESTRISFGYFTDKNNQRWYISSANGSKKVDVYSLMPIKNGRAGWGAVAKSIATVDLNSDTITVPSIENNRDKKYTIKYGKDLIETITSDKLQSDIEMIRNSTVEIKWWFFSVDKAWFIINKSGDAYRFSSKEVIAENGSKSEEYDWKPLDLDDSIPKFFMVNGVKIFKF